MKNNWTIEDYQLVQDHYKYPRLFMLFLLLCIVGILLLLYKFDFEVYEKQSLIKSNNQFFLIIDSRDIENIKQNSLIYMNNQTYPYKIVSISEEFSNVNGIIYQTIYINPYNYETDSIITECYFLKSKKTIYQMLIEFIKGGIG